MTPLHVATVNGHLAFVSRLINDGSNVDYQDGLGRLVGMTIIAVTKTCHSLQLIQTLSLSSSTCLMVASAGGSSDLVRVFVDSKADPSLVDKQGLKALDFAVSRNHHE